MICRRFCGFIQAMIFALLLCTGHTVVAADTELSWEYWQENTPTFQSKALKTVPAFPKSEGTWKKFNPQRGASVPEGTQYLWVRVYIPPDAGADESLFFLTTDQSVQVFLDGVSI